MLLEKRAANYRRLDSTNLDIIFSCLGLIKRALMSGRFIMDLDLSYTDRIELKLKLDKSGWTAGVNTIKYYSLINIWNMVDYFDDLTGFDNRSWMNAQKTWLGLFFLEKCVSINRDVPWITLYHHYVHNR